MSMLPYPCMRYFGFFVMSAFGILLLGAGCTATDTSKKSDVSNDNDEATALVSDFTPSEGRATGPGEKGPWVNRVALATSSDGVTFTAAGQVIGDQFDVPDLVWLPDGSLALYAMAWTAGSLSNQMVVARSMDNGGTWTYHYVDIAGMRTASRGPSPADPDVVVRDDGAVRLYYTYDAKTHYADSEDGLAFTYGGQAFAPSVGMMLDPTVVQLGDTWHLYGGGGPGGDNWHATSTNGKVFTQVASVRATGSDGLRYMLSNGIVQDGKATVWGFSNDGIDIARFTTTDGVAFTAQGLALEYTGGVEEDHVKDASVVQLPDGTYLMAYVTAIPE